LITRFCRKKNYTSIKKSILTIEMDISGYFLGIWLVFGLLIIAIEYYFLAFNRYTEDEISKTAFILLSVAGIAAFTMHLRSTINFSINFLSIVLIPVVSSILYLIGRLKEKTTENALLKKDIRDYLEVIKRKPDISAPYIMLGDIYLKQNKNKKALVCYKKAYQIQPSLETQQKIKIASRQISIEKGRLWVCRECRKDNPSDTTRCSECGTSRNTFLAFKEDIIRNKQDIKKWVIKGFTIPLIGFLALVLLKSILSTLYYTILCVFVAVFLVYLILKRFFTW